MRESPQLVLVSADVAELVRRGVSLVVATRNEDLVPATTRGWGKGTVTRLAEPTRDQLALAKPYGP